MLRLFGRTPFPVDAVNHTARRGTHVQATYADGDNMFLSARECDAQIDTVVQWPAASMNSSPP